MNKKDFLINFLNNAGYNVRPTWNLISELNPYKKTQRKFE